MTELTQIVSNQALRQSLSGTLRIGYYAPIAPAFLPSILSSVAPDPAQVTLHLEECDNDTAQDGLLSGLFDAILFVSEGVRPSVAYDELIKARAYCLMPSAHALAGQGAVSMAQIAQEPLVGLNRPVASAYYRDLFEAGAHDPRIIAYANSTEMVRSLVSAGRGVAILNMQPLTMTSYTGETVVGVPISDAHAPLTLAVGYEKTRPRRLVQSFVDACLAHFNTPGPAQCILRR
ncbi:MAG: LysR substrate-binding domain-containing protein [Aestuariivita sp.]|uniref:LysR substrate-binding domain-containing protein n=1 Tax=Aestuariivita sp. TaxID=1872407 RepID=UPI003BAE8AAE